MQKLDFYQRLRVECVNCPFEQNHEWSVLAVATQGNVLQDSLKVLISICPRESRVDPGLMFQDVLHQVELRRHLPSSLTIGQ